MLNTEHRLRDNRELRRMLIINLGVPRIVACVVSVCMLEALISIRIVTEAAVCKVNH